MLELFTLGITTGTTPTTYAPTSTVSRLQMAAFLSRTVDGTLKRGSARAALDQFWTPKESRALGLTTVGTLPYLVATDGTDVWVANNTSDTVSRARASDGRLLETWTGAVGAYGVLVAMGKVFVAGDNSNLYRIDPAQPAGAVTTVATNLGPSSEQMTFDGARIWTANTPLVSIVTPGASIPWTVTNVSTGFSVPRGILFDGANVWITDAGADKLLKLDAAGAILQTVTVGNQPVYPGFDGSNIWVPNSISNSVTVVRASTGAVLATLTGNGVGYAYAAAFDGQRILIASLATDSLSLFKAADLTPLGNIALTGTPQPAGACSDGINFWVAFSNGARLARF